jgi:hypothetical protein
LRRSSSFDDHAAAAASWPVNALIIILSVVVFAHGSELGLVPLCAPQKVWNGLARFHTLT